MVRNEPVTESVEDSNEPHTVLLPHAVSPVSVICACMDMLLPNLSLILSRTGIQESYSSGLGVRLAWLGTSQRADLRGWIWNRKI